MILGGISNLLDQYVATGYALASTLATDATKDAAARAYGYWQSYERRLEQLAGHGRGQIALSGQFSVGTTGEQISELRRKADFWKAEFQQLVPGEQPGTGALPPVSRATPISFGW